MTYNLFHGIILYMSSPHDRTTGNQYPRFENLGVSFPMPERIMIADTDRLLKETVFATPEVIAERGVAFDEQWPERWRQDRIKTIFQSERSESPFAKYSSQGWKIHIAYGRGREREVSRFLFQSGLYFKTQAGIGTWFNGTHESGSTIYVGSEPAMEQVAQHIQILGSVLTDGPSTELSFKSGEKLRIRNGSGSDIEVLPKILARFDVAKTPHGWASGTGKYAEHGLPSWVVAFGIPGGLPLLKDDNEHLSRLEGNSVDPNDLVDVYSTAQKRAQAELVSDFGEHFVLGYTRLLERVSTSE